MFELTGHYCNNNPPPAPLRLTGSDAELRFRSNEVVQQTGFTVLGIVKGYIQVHILCLCK